MKKESELKLTIDRKEQKDVRWKAFKPILDSKKCSPDCVSIEYCPRKAIIVEKDKPKIDYNLCDGCLICLRECPHGAITEEKNW